MLCFSAVPARAQRALSGKVTSAEGEALAGVTVSSPGTTVGATTDGSGVYRVTVPNDATVLRFAYTGYLAQDVLLGAANVYDVVLQTNANTLQEFVVVGYGTQQKRALTGNIATV